MTARRRYGWSVRHDGCLELHAADPRALAVVGKHPRRLAAMGIQRPRAAAAQIRTEARSLSARAAEVRVQHGIRAEPVMLMITRRGDVTDTWIDCRNPWRRVRARLRKEAA